MRRSCRKGRHPQPPRVRPVEGWRSGTGTWSARACSQAYSLMPRMLSGASMSVRRQRFSQGCSHTRPHAVGNGLSLRIICTAPALSPAATSAMYAGTFTCAGQKRLARHRLAHVALARMLAHMAFDLGGEGVQALQQGVGRLVADGAIRRVAHHLRQRAHALDLGGVGLAIHQMAQHGGQLRQAVAARHALAARLQRAFLQQRQLLRQRAHARRHGVDAAFLPVQEPADAGVVRRGGRNGQSRHFSPVSPACAGLQHLHGDGNGTSRPIELLIFDTCAVSYGIRRRFRFPSC